MTSKIDPNDPTYRILHSEADMKYAISKLGDHFISSGQVDGRTLKGIEAVYAYLVTKHHWLPREVRAMSLDDLQLALHEELKTHSLQG